MSTRFAVSPAEGPLSGYVLRDAEAGTEARILPEVGANCIALRAPAPNGEMVDALRGPDSAEQLRGSPARYGLPLLFPFPNRIANGRYTFEGQTYQFPVNSRGNAIHGLVLDQRFRVEAADAGAQGAHLRCVLAHADLPRTEGYPFAFRFVADYYLHGSTLTLTVSAINTGDRTLPFGFGIHPYFRTPLVDRGRRDDCLISAPVGSRWELSPELIPAGQRTPLAVDDPLRDLRPLAGRTYDNVYGDVAVMDGRSTCRLVDPAAGLAVALEADANFREMVVYAPPGLPAVCFEPYTCATDAFNLNERGIDAGRLALAGGQAWSATIRVVVGPA